MTLVTAVVSSYNYSASLRLCLQALRDQTYPSLDVLVVDDCSTDDSVAVAESMGFTVISPERNGGVAAARNLGVSRAAGEIVFFVDSDVALHPEAVARAVALLESDPRIGAACGIYDPEPLIRDSLVEEYRSLQAHYWRLSSVGVVSFLFSSLCAMPRHVLAEVGPFNPRLNGGAEMTEEVDYGERLSARYDIHLSADVRGRHDDDSRLRPLLRKLFHRGRLRIPLYARRRRFAKGFETSTRAYASLAALAGVGLLPLAALLGPWGLLGPGLAVAASIGLDAGMYAFVARRRGPLFLLYFTAVHFLVNLAISSGVGAGVAQWLVSRRFRGLYEADPAAVGA
ncbi:glycosyltransferase [Longispora sp. NPDC051575]|uniref:glycosyltransferase family 2 protein n=1 Tax=Longispora sp. NPDC051575 TaxID=3154943 RepID=UPI003447605F